VMEVPPFLFAGMRFVVAGAALFICMRVRGTALPNLTEWAAVLLPAVLIFVLDYGLLFWAEQRVPSGIASVMMATIPIFMGLLEIVVLRTQQLKVGPAMGLLVGIGGVAVLVSRSGAFGETPIDGAGAIALLVASVSWSTASILMRKLPLPASKPMSSAAQMLAGGVLLTVTAGVLGEFHGFQVGTVSRAAWFALAYLIVAGSIVAFTTYVWLIHCQSPTKVGTYAYVNPVVAVIIGYFLGGEVVGTRTLFGTLFVLISVVVITTMPAKRAETEVGYRSRSHTGADIEKH
jgi:drug/metabolite transporter (DMT)-like permease